MRKKVRGFKSVYGKISRKDITVGCDPEFEVLRNGNVVRATEVVGYSTSAAIGADGAGRPLEVRPEASATASTVVKNVKGLRIEFWRAQTWTGERILGGKMEIHPPIESHFRTPKLVKCEVCDGGGCHVCKGSGICPPGAWNKWKPWQIENMRARAEAVRREREER